jgi:hypothetical protein
MEAHRLDMSQPDAFENRVKDAIQNTALKTNPTFKEKSIN